MRITEDVHARISARARADRLINQLTAGVALGAVAALGVFAAVDGITIPGASSTTSTSSTSTSTTSATSTSTVQASSGSVSSSSSTGVAVTGGSN